MAHNPTLGVQVARRAMQSLAELVGVGRPVAVRHLDHLEADRDDREGQRRAEQRARDRQLHAALARTAAFLAADPPRFS
jgi:hypothetical protein